MAFNFYGIPIYIQRIFPQKYSKFEIIKQSESVKEQSLNM